MSRAASSAKTTLDSPPTSARTQTHSPGAWSTPLQHTSEPKVVTRRSREDVGNDADKVALGYATQQRSLRAQSIKATLLPFVTGGREVSDRDKSGKMNLTPDNLKGLRRSYSIGTHLEFQTLLPRGTTILDGHKDDVQGKAGFRDNRKGPYLNYLFAAPPRGTALNAHVRLGESEFKADQDRAHEDHMYKNKHLWE